MAAGKWTMYPLRSEAESGHFDIPHSHFEYIAGRNDKSN
jgi:hypothetical protein